MPCPVASGLTWVHLWLRWAVSRMPTASASYPLGLTWGLLLELWEFSLLLRSAGELRPPSATLSLGDGRGWMNARPSKSMVGIFKGMFYMVSQRAPSKTEGLTDTTYLEFFSSLSHFPYPLTQVSEDHFSKKLLAPKSLYWDLTWETSNLRHGPNYALNWYWVSEEVIFFSGSKFLGLLNETVELKWEFSYLLSYRALFKKIKS